MITMTVLSRDICARTTRILAHSSSTTSTSTLSPSPPTRTRRASSSGGPKRSPRKTNSPLPMRSCWPNCEEGAAIGPGGEKHVGPMSCIVGALSALGPVFTFEYVRRWESYETEDCECHPPPPPPPSLVLPARSIAHLRMPSHWTGY